MPPALANPITQLVLAAVLGATGVFLLLPKPKVRWVAGGVALTLAGIAVLGVFLWTRFGQPMFTTAAGGDLIGSTLFWLFAAGAVGFGCVLVAQRNPARGAIAFAFVIISTCGLFLLLAAPFLMAATIIIYAGAIVVTFLFVLMLSHVKGPSDENDRTREPLLGSLAGFAFVGLLLFTLHLSSPSAATAGEGTASSLPAAPLATDERQLLDQALGNLNFALSGELDDQRHDKILVAANAVYDVTRNKVVLVKDEVRLVGPLEFTKSDPRAIAFAEQTKALVKANNAVLNKPDDKAALTELRNQLLVYRGNGLLPARNVTNIGLLLYSEHLLAVEMAGTPFRRAAMATAPMVATSSRVPA
jgi:NADH-quinone oxidoreductase subunit J